MSDKKIIIRQKTADGVDTVLPSTDSSIVSYNETTVEQELDAFNQHVKKPATTSELGHVIPDGESIVVRNGVISAVKTIPKVTIYGVKIDTLNSNPETAVEYVDDAVGFTPLKVTGEVTNWGSWADVYPFNQIVPIVVKEGVEQYELDPNDFTKKKDGTAAVITGPDGDVFIRFPKIWWNFERVGTDLFIRFSTEPVRGFKCLAHTVGGVEKEFVYIGAYLGFLQTDKIRSISGNSPTGNKVIGEFRTLAEANGNSYTQFDYYKLLMVQILALVATKNRSSEDSLGYSYRGGFYSKAGDSDKKGMVYGNTDTSNTTKVQIKVFGIEDLFGGRRAFIDGIVIDRDKNILIAGENFNDTGEGYTNYGLVTELSMPAGFTKEIQGGTETGFIPKESGGSSTTYYASNSSVYAGLANSILIFGRYAIFDMNFNTATAKDSQYASRLCFTK